MSTFVTCSSVLGVMMFGSTRLPPAATPEVNNTRPTARLATNERGARRKRPNMDSYPSLWRTEERSPPPMWLSRNGIGPTAGRVILEAQRRHSLSALRHVLSGALLAGR